MFDGATLFNNGCAAGVDCPMNWTINPGANTDGMFDNAPAFAYGDTLFGAKDPSTLSVSDYAAKGINGVTLGNIDAINSIVVGRGADAQKDKASLDALVDAYEKLLSLIENGTGDLTADDLAALGLDGVLGNPNGADKLSLFNSILKLTPKREASTVDSFAELMELANIVAKIVDSAATSEADATITKGKLVAVVAESVDTGTLAINIKLRLQQGLGRINQLKPAEEARVAANGIPEDRGVGSPVQSKVVLVFVLPWILWQILRLLSAATGGIYQAPAVQRQRQLVQDLTKLRPMKADQRRIRLGVVDIHQRRARSPSIPRPSQQCAC
jgi:hypothetical protein